MKKIIFIFIKGISFGFGIGLCLAGFVALVYREAHSGNVNFNPGHATVYFFAIGGLMGLFGGWCFSLQMVLGNRLAFLFLKVADLVPMPAQVVGEEWVKKMEVIFREIIQPFPGFFQKFIEWVFILRFEDYGRINRAVEKAKKRERPETTTTQWMLMMILHYLLEPLWLLFYVVYAILLLTSCVFWSFPFLK